MQLKKYYIYRAVVYLLVAAYCLHTSSCASTKAAPSGGPKDTIPPTVLEVYPPEGAVNFPLQKGEITITFNEYVQIKDANKNILLSPPQKKPVKARIKKKGIVVEFQEPLDSNTTYSLNFGNSIADNNEGNLLGGFSYSFSTGNVVDSMMLSGTVVDAVTLFPIENATIALYQNNTDSIAMTTLPAAVARSDKWGYFTVKNIKPIPYTVFAFSDENTNNKYDQGVEKIAFLDTLVVPTEVMRKDSPQLQYINPLDTAALQARPSQVELQLFQEKSLMQFIKDHKRFSRRGSYIKFNAADVQIDSFSIAGIKDEQIIKQFNITKDSLVFWVNEPGNLPDTLKLGIKYHKTDTSGNLSPATENLKLVAPIKKKKDKDEQKSEKREDLLEFTIMSDNKKVEQEGIQFQFNEPLAVAGFDSITFTMSTPKQIKSNVEFSIVQDSLDMKKYTLLPSVQFVKGNDYLLKIPEGAFRDINGFYNDSTDVKITLPNNDNASSITVSLVNVDARYIVELINDTRSTVYRRYIINDDSELLFPYLDKGKYSIRITEDKNSNGLFDTGEYLARKQAEKVMLYTLPGGTSVINLSERTDLVQDIDIAVMFGK